MAGSARETDYQYGCSGRLEGARIRAKQIRFILVFVMPMSVSSQQSDDHSCDSSKYKHQDEKPKRKRTARLNIDQVLQRIHRQRITDGPQQVSGMQIREDDLAGSEIAEMLNIRGHLPMFKAVARTVDSIMNPVLGTPTGTGVVS